MKKKKNPQDSTLRNVRAANKKIAELNKRVEALTEWVDHLLKCVWQYVGKSAAEEFALELANVSQTKQVPRKKDNN